MRTLEVTLTAATRANEALEDNRNLFQYLTQTSSNTYDLNPDEDGLMDEEQLEFEVMHQLCSAGIEPSEFWFNGSIY